MSFGISQVRFIHSSEMRVPLNVSGRKSSSVGISLKKLRYPSTRGNQAAKLRAMAEGTSEQVESKVNDVRMLSVTLHCMLASFFYDRLVSAVAEVQLSHHTFLVTHIPLPGTSL